MPGKGPRPLVHETICRTSGTHLYHVRLQHVQRLYDVWPARRRARRLSSSKAVIEEFANLGKYSARTAWSNINRAAMTLLTKIRSDRDLMAQLELERMSFAKSLRRRADIFTYEADRCGLPYVPYKGGFFISIPTQQSAAVCQALEADLVFAGPLAQGVRLASAPYRKSGCRAWPPS